MSESERLGPAEGLFYMSIVMLVGGAAYSATMYYLGLPRAATAIAIVSATCGAFGGLGAGAIYISQVVSGS